MEICVPFPICDHPARFEIMADEVFRRYRRRWKPRTMRVNRSYLRNQILPWFAGRPIGAISHSEVRRWFASLNATPAAANRSLPILSVILREAEIDGHRPHGSNPCSGIRRYRRSGRDRFLTPEELRELGAALAKREGEAPLPTALILLLLITGCRQGEVRALRWRDYREGHLFLPDSKTGPRTVWLSSAAQRLLDRLPRTNEWVFPAAEGDRPMSSDTLYAFWRLLLVVSGLRDVRLHDLHHTYASLALRQGETVLTIGRLLGHRDPATTLRYTHFAPAAMRDAVEAVGSMVGA